MGAVCVSLSPCPEGVVRKLTGDSQKVVVLTVLEPAPALVPSHVVEGVSGRP